MSVFLGFLYFLGFTVAVVVGLELIVKLVTK